jgi:hypothetical protein
VEGPALLRAGPGAIHGVTRAGPGGRNPGQAPRRAPPQVAGHRLRVARVAVRRAQAGGHGGSALQPLQEHPSPAGQGVGADVFAGAAFGRGAGLLALRRGVGLPSGPEELVSGAGGAGRSPGSRLPARAPGDVVPARSRPERALRLHGALRALGGGQLGGPTHGPGVQDAHPLPGAHRAAAQVPAGRVHWTLGPRPRASPGADSRRRTDEPSGDAEAHQGEPGQLLCRRIAPQLRGILPSGATDPLRRRAAQPDFRHDLRDGGSPAVQPLGPQAGGCPLPLPACRRGRQHLQALQRDRAQVRLGRRELRQVGRPPRLPQPVSNHPAVLDDAGRHHLLLLRQGATATHQRFHRARNGLQHRARDARRERAIPRLRAAHHGPQAGRRPFWNHLSLLRAHRLQPARSSELPLRLRLRRVHEEGLLLLPAPGPRGRQGAGAPVATARLPP